jgi:hypothetical protein
MICAAQKSYLSNEESVVSICDLQAHLVRIPCGLQLGEDLQRQGHVGAPHVEVHYNAAVARLCGSHMDVQELKVNAW